MYRSHSVSILNTICVSLCAAVLFSGPKPEITLSQYIVSPRINLFNDSTHEYPKLPGVDEYLHYRTRMDARYQISERIRMSCITEYGTQNYRYDKSFRIQSLTTAIQFKKSSMVIGRQTIRNPFYNTYIDGIRLNGPLDTGMLFSLSAGYIPKFYIGSGQQKQIIQTSGRFPYKKGVTTFSVWDIVDQSENAVKAGLINRHRFSDHLNFTTYLSWDMKENLPFYNRFHLKYARGSHSVYLGYRQRIFNIEDLYPWILSEKWIISSLYAGGYYRFWNELTLHIRFDARNSNQQGSQFQTSLQYKQMNLTVIRDTNDNDKLFGGMLSAQQRVTGKITVGGNISLNSKDIDGEPELDESKSIYGWADMKISRDFKIRIFGQYSENSYFTQDGRGGVFLTYEF